MEHQSKVYKVVPAILILLLSTLFYPLSLETYLIWYSLIELKFKYFLISNIFTYNADIISIILERY